MNQDTFAFDARTFVLDFSGQKIKSLPKSVKSPKGELVTSEILGAALIVTGCEQLTSLRGAPKRVATLRAKGCTALKSLVGGPEEVQGNVFLGESGVTSLEGLIKVKGVVNLIGCWELTSLHGIGVQHLKSCMMLHIPHTVDSHVLGLLLVDKLEDVLVHPEHASPKLNLAIKIVLKHLKKGQDGLIDCQHELIDEGLEDFAEL